VRQQTSCTQKDHILLHTDNFLTSNTAAAFPSGDKTALEVRIAERICSSSLESTEPGPAIGFKGRMFFRVRLERWFFTSVLRGKLIATPVILLLAWKVLVWSKA
jgi:hypothetical protein